MHRHSLLDLLHSDLYDPNVIFLVNPMHIVYNWNQDNKKTLCTMQKKCLLSPCNKWVNKMFIGSKNKSNLGSVIDAGVVSGEETEEISWSISRSCCSIKHICIYSMLHMGTSFQVCGKFGIIANIISDFMYSNAVWVDFLLFVQQHSQQSLYHGQSRH